MVGRPDLFLAPVRKGRNVCLSGVANRQAGVITQKAWRFAPGQFLLL